jgi:hypothetical protein
MSAGAREQLKEVGAPFFVDREDAEVLGITPRLLVVGGTVGGYYLDRTLDADSIRRVQAFLCMPTGGRA